MRQNKTHRSKILVLYCTLQDASAVQISHHQIDVGYTNRNIKGERPLVSVLWIITILLKNLIIMLKLIH